MLKAASTLYGLWWLDANASGQDSLSSVIPNQHMGATKPAHFQEGQAMLNVFFADDESAFQNAFVNRHSGPEFQVYHTSDVYAIPHMLTQAHQVPDLVVLDLYTTKASPGSVEANQQNDSVNAHLEALDRTIDKLKKVVNEVKKPAAIEVLREIRRNPRFKNLPVLLYTRQGLSLLSDDELHEALRLNADWMLKGRSKEFERARMEAYVEEQKRQKGRLQRDVSLMLAGAVLGAILGSVLSMVF